VVKPVRDFVAWISAQNEPGLSPRLLLHAMHRYGHALRFDTSSDIAELFPVAWLAATSAYGEIDRDGDDEPNSDGAIARVDARWQRVQLEGSGNFATHSAEVADLISWALAEVAVHFDPSCTIDGINRGQHQALWYVHFVVRKKDGIASARRIFLCDASNYRGRLVQQVSVVKDMAAAGAIKSFAARPFGSFPMGPYSAVKQELDKLRDHAGAAFDLLPAEMINMSQLATLQASVDRVEFAEWAKHQSALLLPKLRFAVAS
jgi:hypothetical protein